LFLIIYKMKLLLLFIYLFINIVLSSQSNIQYKDLFPSNDLNRNITELIKARGYIYEEHKVTTPDGYILKLFRIPNKRYDKIKKQGKPVVLLQHGFEDIGTTWVNQEIVHQSLGFYLADKGFDVWISNSRGTLLSNEHVNNSIFNTMYWNFTLNELAEFDIPTCIDYILDVANRKQLSYIGHSQGTSIGFIAFNSNKKLEKKVNLFIALGPVTILTHSPIAKSAASIPLFESYLRGFMYTGFLNGASILQQPAAFLCKLFPDICLYPLQMIEGMEVNGNINKTRLPVYISHVPGGSSTKNLLHWMQIYHNGFKKFDYGHTENWEIYGQNTPPEYKLSESNIPTMFYTGTNDLFSTFEDVGWLAPQIKNLIKWKNIKDFSHLDFIWSVNSHKEVYDDFIDTLLNYNNITKNSNF
ncbi:hypothetical protein DICPUDRAFT_34411, partial [Dictyostelium purpureum]